MHTIGLDVGGTHTDGVILNAEGKAVAWGKTTTTPHLGDGIRTIIAQLLAQTNIKTETILRVVMGTTHATNAILEGKHLLPTGLLRLLNGKPRYPSSGFGWPQALKHSVIGAVECCEGGYECDGKASPRFNRREVREAIERLLEAGVGSISVVGAFSPLNGNQEGEVQDLVQEIVGGPFPVTLSHKIGGIGLIERENATLLNSALKQVIAQEFASIKRMLHQMGILAPFWMTQNNGSLLSIEEAIDFPIRTIGAGPTNSFIGAAKLCALADAIVVDIGGTSTDIGIIEGGYARGSFQAAAIGGIPLHFAMPDMISLALGGGSCVELREMGRYQVGPHSVAKQLQEKSRVFGGNVLTLTDIGVMLGYMPLEGRGALSMGLGEAEAKTISQEVCRQVYQSIVRLRGRKHTLPVILVGGGALLLQQLFERDDIEGIIPEGAGIANAYGAGLAEISGTVDKVVSLKEREETLNALKEEAKEEVIRQGCDEKKVRIARVSILPFAYTSEALARVSVTAAGPA